MVIRWLAPVAVVGALCSSGVALAGPLADSLARHSDRDVAALRQQRADRGARCTLGAIYAKRNDLSRAALYLDSCSDGELPGEVASEVARIARDVARAVRDSELARVEIVADPESLTLEATISALPGESFRTPATLFVPAGSYTVSATRDGVALTKPVTLARHSRGVVVLEAAVKRNDKPVGQGNIDFTLEVGAETQTSGPPPDVKHKPLTPKKYTPGLAASDDPDQPNPNALDDPMEVRAAPRPPRALWLGGRLGGGVFDDAAGSPRAGVAVAASLRLTVGSGWFVAGRADWSRRGAGAIDSLGISAGIGHPLGSLPVAAFAQLRGDLRFGDAMADRAGASLAAAAELAIPSSPMTVGIRVEQGITPLTAGGRDRALMLEVGADWR